MSSNPLFNPTRLARCALLPMAVVALIAITGLDVFSQGTPAKPAAQATGSEAQGMARYTKYFAEMEDDVSVYDPASPWIYSGKTAWYKRVEQMIKIRQFLDLNQFHRQEVEIGDMRVTTFYRELRRVEGSMTSRLHGRITFVHLKRPDGTWSLWHDHTSEIPEDFSYEH